MSCIYCRMDTYGNHAYNCPNNPTPRKLSGGYEPVDNGDQEYLPPEGGTGEIQIDLGSVKTPDIFKELKDLKRHNIVGKTMEESKTGHYVSYDDVLRLFHKYWGK